MTERITSHRIAVALRALALALALPTTACTATTLSSLQSDFESLQTTKTECSAGGSQDSNVTGGDGAATLCLADYGATFLDLAQQARAAADDAGDARSQIALLRLAAMAGWQSRLPEGLDLTDAVAVEGMEACAAIDPNTFGAPRDCALLRLAPAFSRHVRAVVFIDGLPEEPSTFDAGQKDALQAQAQTYVPNTLSAMDRVRADLLTDPELSASMLRYLERQRVVVYCTALDLAMLAAQSGESDLSEVVLSAAKSEFADGNSGVLDQVSCSSIT